MKEDNNMTIKEMKEKENEIRLFKDCRDVGIYIDYPGVSIRFNHLELAEYFIKGILDDMLFDNPHAHMVILNKDKNAIADVGLNYSNGGVDACSHGLYEINGLKTDYSHLIDDIFERIENEEAM